MKLSEPAANRATDAVLKPISGGYLRVYDGKGLVLVELRFRSPAFPAAAGGEAAAQALERARIKNSGRAETYRVLESDGTTEVFSGPVADLSVQSSSDGTDDPWELQEFGEFSVDRFVYRHPRGN